MSSATVAEATQTIDINNLVLSDEIMDGFDPTANQFAAPPPVKAGLYTATLSFASDDSEKRWFPISYNGDKYPEKAGKSYSKTRLIGRISQSGGEFDGRRVQDSFCSTGIFGQQVTSKVASLIHLFGRGEELTGIRTDTELRELFENCLAAEPQVKIVTSFEWQGKDTDGGYVTVRGDDCFSTDEKGKPVLMLPDASKGGELTQGYAVITKYLSA